MIFLIENKIRVIAPTNDITAWCIRWLDIPNPDYAKKKRMGFSTYRTPAIISLWEKSGDEILIPYGCLEHLMQDFPDGTDNLWLDGTVPEPYQVMNPRIPLYEYQVSPVEEMLRHHCGILQAPAGSGKTQMGLAIIQKRGLRALWLTHTKDLLKQSRERAEMYGWTGLGTITEGKVDIGTHVTFATVQTMANMDLTIYRNMWDIIITDECFPAGTMIATQEGEKPIEQVRIGDRVLTINEKTKETEYREVTYLYEKVPHSLMTINLSNGTTLTCTENHPILTNKGYIKAGDLIFGNINDEVCCLRKDIRPVSEIRNNFLRCESRTEKTVLFDKVCEDRTESKQYLDRRTQRSFQAMPDCCKQEVCFSKNESTQPYEQSEDPKKSIGNTAENKPSTTGTRWERTRDDNSAENNDGCTGDVQPASRICGRNRSHVSRISTSLQDRHSNTRGNACDRSGRRFPLLTEGSGEGQKESELLEWVGVDSIACYEPTSDRTYGGMCSGGFVYNLEVEGNHNYFANGVNVHNCHRVAGSPTAVTMFSKVLNNLKAQYKYGLSATVHRADGLIRCTYALIGEVAAIVPKSAVEKTVMPVTIRPRGTGIRVTNECLMPDGTLNYQRTVKMLTEDEDRNSLIVSDIVNEYYAGHYCLILSDRVHHLQRLMDRTRERLEDDDAVLIDGKMSTGKKKQYREQAIEDMRTGKKGILFATYALAKEGLDIPRLDRLFLVTPHKDYAVITQSIGRIARRSDGKDSAVCYDYVDSIRSLVQAYKRRCSTYRKQDCIIEEES